MRLKVPCPSCGKNLRYDEPDAGQQALCRACGTRVALPVAPLLGPLTSVSKEPTGLAADERAAGDGPIPLPALSGLEPPAGAVATRTGDDSAAVDQGPGSPPARRNLRSLLTVSAGAAACVAIVGLVFVARGRLTPGRTPARSAFNERTTLQAPVVGATRGGVLAGPTGAPEPPATRPAAPASAIAPNSVASAVPGPAARLASPLPETLAPTVVAPPVGGPVAPPRLVPLPAAAPAAPAPAPRPLPQAEPAEPPAAPPPPRPAPRPVVDGSGGLTDEQIGAAIQKGVDYLLDQFDPKTHTLRNGGDRNDVGYFAGMDALAVYALLQSGQAINDPRLSVRGSGMRAKLDALKALPIQGWPQTYARALRATCLALYDRPEDLQTLREDGEFLLSTANNGAYTYGAGRRSGGPGGRRGFGGFGGLGWDNSNSQYGLLGVWSAADAEPSFEVPLSYWRAVARHWTECQFPTGEWGYTVPSGAPRMSMTCAGIASLFVANEYLDPPGMLGGSGVNPTATVGRDPFTPHLKRALDWFETGNNSVDLSQARWWGYTLYGIERVGLASGFKHFGEHDWYRELAADAIRRQGFGGSWGDGILDTSYALVFLSRGRHPIMMSKLRFDRRGSQAVAYWSNRPRDLANAARFATRQLERPVNWQVVSIDNPWTDWMDSPVLYIASHEPPKFTDEDYAKLRSFAEAGGMIFTHADIGAPKFNAWAAELAHKLFPKYEMADLPADHPIYNIVFRPAPAPPLKAVSNGSRVLLLHSPTDLALRWQQRQDRAWEGRRGTAKGDGRGDGNAQAEAALRAAQLAPFHLAVNVFVYAAGKRDLRNRIDSPWVAPLASSAGSSAPEPLRTVRVARLQYAGNWDPEPGAWRRFANWFRRQSGYAVDVRPVKLADLKPADAPFAHLTGTARHTFTAEDAAALKRYIEAGGVVLVDTCGGAGPFDNDVRALLSAAFPAGYPSAIASDHPLLNAGRPGMNDVARPRLRPYTVERLGGHAGALNMVRAGRGHVIVTNLDVTTGLLGTGTWGILGYEPATCMALTENALFWTLDGQPDKPLPASTADAEAE